MWTNPASRMASGVRFSTVTPRQLVVHGEKVTDATIFRVECRAAPIDITDAKHAAEREKRSNGYFSNASAQSLFAIGAGGNCTWIDPAAATRWLDPAATNAFIGLVMAALRW